MKNYTNYLEKKGFSTKSIPTYLTPIRDLQKWVKQYGTTIESIDYKTCLLYLETLNKKGISKKTVQSYLIALSKYFNYLQEENYRSDNPIDGIKIQGIPKTKKKDILDFEELENLYYSYETDNADYIRKRNKIILGLLIYQGLKTQEIYSLQVENIKLQKGQIEIQGSRKSNGRVLNLMAWQFMDLQEYQNQIRPSYTDRKAQESEQFFLSAKGKTTLRNSLKPLHDELKTYNRNYHSFKQIRASVITYWLEQYNLRKVQYLAGHRYISSTEQYQQDNLEELHQMVNVFHPIQ